MSSRTPFNREAQVLLSIAVHPMTWCNREVDCNATEESPAPAAAAEASTTVDRAPCAVTNPPAETPPEGTEEPREEERPASVEASEGAPVAERQASAPAADANAPDREEGVTEEASGEEAAAADPCAAREAAAAGGGAGSKRCCGNRRFNRKCSCNKCISWQVRGNLGSSGRGGKPGGGGGPQAVQQVAHLVVQLLPAQAQQWRINCRWCCRFC